MRLVENASLRPLTSIGIGGFVAALIKLQEVDDVLKAFSLIRTKKLPYYIIGGGSNVVFDDKRYDGVLIKSEIEGIDIVSKDDKHLFIQCGSGVPWDKFVEFAIDNRCWGCENMSIIPGSVGGIPIQNVGAYGQEASQIIYEVYAYDILNSQFITLSNRDCRFGYRESIFNREYPGRYLILRVTFRLSRKASPCLSRLSLAPRDILAMSPDHALHSIRGEVIRCRTNGTNLPNLQSYGSLGTFFKTGIIVGWAKFIYFNLKALFGLGPFNLISILAFMIQHRRGNKFKVPTRFLIAASGLSDTRFGNVFLWPSNPSVVVTELSRSPRFSDLTATIDLVRSTLASKVGYTVPIEPQVVTNFFSIPRLDQ